MTLDDVAISERFSYYDQVHTAPVPISNNPPGQRRCLHFRIIQSVTAQSALRMRKLLTSQTLELLVPGPTAKQIKKEGDLKFNDLLIDALVRQSGRLAMTWNILSGKICAISHMKNYSTSF